VLAHLSQAVPGPQLAAALAGVDRATVGADDLVVLAAARCRQIAHDHGQLLADLALLLDAYRGPDTPKILHQDAIPLAALEVAAELRWTRGSAQYWVALADDLVYRLPEVHAAMLAGQVDLPRCRVFSDLLAGVDDPIAHKVVDQILPDAATLTTGQLRSGSANSSTPRSRSRRRSNMRRASGAGGCRPLWTVTAVPC
jgi:hypothetical protein